MDLIDVKGDVVTIDAMGCQREIARKIVDKQADYVLAVKGNQPDLHDVIKDYYLNTDEQPVCIEHEKNRDRIERREYFLCTDEKFVQSLGNGKWTNLQVVGMVRSTVTHKDGKTTVAQRYYITTLRSPEKFTKSVRGHWSIESMHWTLDVVFGEDKNRTKRDHAPKNLNILRKTAMTLLANLEVGVTRPSYRLKMLAVQLDPEKHLAELFT